MSITRDYTWKAERAAAKTALDQAGTEAILEILREALRTRKDFQDSTEAIRKEAQTWKDRAIAAETRLKELRDILKSY